MVVRFPPGEGARPFFGYKYDPLGKLAQITDALQRVALYQYDELGRLILEKRADGAQYKSHYDLAGNLIGSTDPNGTVSTYGYTPTYKVQSLSKSRGSQSGSATYGYDAAGNMTFATVDGAGASYGVNAYRERVSVNRGGEAVSLTLDGAGRREGLSVVDGATTISSTSYQYAGGPLLASVTGWVRAFTWNTAGQLQGESLANGTSLSLGYEGSGRVSSMGWSGAVGLPSYSLSYDRTGNVTGKNGGSYVYDALNRLITSEDVGPVAMEKGLQPWIADTDYAGVQELVIADEDVPVLGGDRPGGHGWGVWLPLRCQRGACGEGDELPGRLRWGCDD
jgi:YD repeat-containing protein